MAEYNVLVHLEFITQLCEKVSENIDIQGGKLEGLILKNDIMPHAVVRKVNFFRYLSWKGCIF